MYLLFYSFLLINNLFCGNTFDNQYYYEEKIKDNTMDNNQNDLENSNINNDQNDLEHSKNPSANFIQITETKPQRFIAFLKKHKKKAIIVSSSVVILISYTEHNIRKKRKEKEEKRKQKLKRLTKSKKSTLIKKPIISDTKSNTNQLKVPVDSSQVKNKAEDSEEEKLKSKIQDSHLKKDEQVKIELNDRTQDEERKPEVNDDQTNNPNTSEESQQNQTFINEVVNFEESWQKKTFTSQVIDLSIENHTSVDDKERHKTSQETLLASTSHNQSNKLEIKFENQRIKILNMKQVSSAEELNENILKILSAIPDDFLRSVIPFEQNDYFVTYYKDSKQFYKDVKQLILNLICMREVRFGSCKHLNQVNEELIKLQSTTKLEQWIIKVENIINIYFTQKIIFISFLNKHLTFLKSINAKFNDLHEINSSLLWYWDHLNQAKDFRYNSNKHDCEIIQTFIEQIFFQGLEGFLDKDDIKYFCDWQYLLQDLFHPKSPMINNITELRNASIDFFDNMNMAFKATFENYFIILASKSSIDKSDRYGEKRVAYRRFMREKIPLSFITNNHMVIPVC